MEPSLNDRCLHVILSEIESGTSSNPGILFSLLNGQSIPQSKSFGHQPVRSALASDLGGITAMSASVSRRLSGGHVRLSSSGRMISSTMLFVTSIASEVSARRGDIAPCI